jgi:hypothetical protein
MRRKRVGWRAVVGAALMLAGMSAFPSASHDWYPMECCSGTDCAVVEHVTYASSANAETDLPILVVTTKHGTARVPPNFPRRPSKDGEMHACIRSVQDTMKLICLFVPPPS